MPNVQPIPEDYPRLTPYLFLHDAAAAIDFYTRIFGATERMRMPMPDGKLAHAELDIGSSVVMLSDEAPEMNALGPKSTGASPLLLHLYVEDVDSVVAAALEAGATQEAPVEDKFYGDRSGTIVDPFGYRWSLSTHVEDVPPDEMEKRAAEAAANASGS